MGNTDGGITDKSIGGEAMAEEAIEEERMRQEEQVKEILEIPEEMTVVALLPIGVPDEIARPRTIKDFNEIFSGEKFGKSLIL